MGLPARKLVASIAAAVLLAGCGGGGSGEDNEDGDSVAASASPESTEDGGDGGEQSGEITVRGCKPQNPLIPSNTNETCGGSVLDPVLAKLVRYDSEDGHPVMDIAESVETKDNITWTVKLKEDVKFHDGTKVTAASFIDAWNWGAYGPHGQLNSYFYEPIAGFADLQSTGKKKPKKRVMSGLKKVDDYEFTVTMGAKNSTFLQRLGYTAFAALPKSFFADDGESFGTKPIGAGAFKMVKADRNREFVLEADPDYDRVGRPSISKVTFKVFSKIDAAYKELQDDQIDMIDEIPTDSLVDDLFKEDLDERVMERPVGIESFILFPPSKTDDSYDSPKLRHAISMSIDRDTITKNVFNGARVPATGWVSPVADGYEEGACGEYCEYAPEAAKKLFDEAGGYDDGPLTIAYNADSSNKDWIDAACISISKALDVECLGKPTPTFAEIRQRITERKQKGMFGSGWQMDYPSIENFLGPLYGTGAGSNDGDYTNKKFDAQLKKAAGEIGADAVNEAYRAAERMLADGMPAVPLWYRKSQGGFSKNIASANFTVFGTYDLASVRLKD